MISRFIEDRNIAADRNQISRIERLFLGFNSNDSCIFRRGDAVLVLEIAKFVRSKFEGNEDNAKEEYLFSFDINHAAKQSQTTKSPVGELFTPDGMNFEVKGTISEESNPNDGKAFIHHSSI